MLEEEAARLLLETLGVFTALRPRMPARWIAVFAYVSSRPNCRMSDARAALDLDASELMECIKGLEQELGLIARGPGANGRERSLSITDRGKVVADQVTRAASQLAGSRDGAA